MDPLDEVVPQPGAHGWSPEEGRRHEMKGPFHLPKGPDGLSFVLFQSTGVSLQPGHQVELIENGAIFERMLEDIRQAQQSIHILVYIWRPCDVSDRFVEALRERVSAGVKCRVVVDPVGSEEVRGDKDFDQKIEQKLVECGVEVHYYRPLAGKVLGRILGRTHQKLVIVDGHIGYTGGFGIWKVWEGDGLAPEQWRDTHIRVEGPSVCQMQLAFSRAWQESGGSLLHPEDLPAARHPGPVRAGFIASAGKLGMTDAERMVRIVIGSARKRLWIANAYFTPPNAIMEQLIHKAHEGVDVRILGPGPVHDVPIIRASQRATYAELLRAGARIWEYQRSMMHAKTILVDDWLSVVGSTNFDALSLNKLGEGSMVVADKALAQKLEQGWMRDFEHSREITLATGGTTNPWRRLARRMTQLVGQDR
ncbi:phospholipase D-like domain-containing protein [Stigmatella sp. ncwal1]|uniref:Phospholipase D-like domain-containing protein n=1 Tax=Stigmatella ashevillensis TaxID=2995309 RepID=A0ABT5DA37_9BACT|nr:phospholipase D-like domain-containing protein [Stigmatella ashevillena]MDC0710530.1 phospholipase D-like domain-containing protein [Stigmatella ashevillena]